MLDNPSLRSRLKFAETESFILRVMVATLILYDHVHPTGAFAKGDCFFLNAGQINRVLSKLPLMRHRLMTLKSRIILPRIAYQVTQLMGEKLCGPHFDGLTGVHCVMLV